MQNRPLFVRNAAQLVTFSGGSKGPLAGRRMKELSIIENGSVWMEQGKIAAVGPDDELMAAYRERMGEAEVVDASGKLVTPGLVDPHTQLMFAGSREQEFAMRLQGKTYMEIYNAGGGIRATVRATRQADADALFEASRGRLDQFLLHGVTTVEAKSGYGLTLEDELKQLEVARRLHQSHPVDVVSTFMGAHAVPLEYKDDPDRFVDEVVSVMIPEVARRELAEFNDVFCEQGVFTPEQARKILLAGKEHGLWPKIHADEIEPYGGAELAAEVGAVSADHLLKASEEGMRRMAAAGVIGVLLPGTAFFLMAEFAKARKMIDLGVPVALSTDCNPGSSPTVSLPFIMNLGCLKMGMTPEEVLAATTVNAAHAIRRGHEIGSLEKGKKADLVIFRVANYMQLQYGYAVNHVDTVIKNGNVVVKGGRLL